VLQGMVWGLFFAASAGAQTFVASIGGIVRDTSGAVMPGVKVTVTNIHTNVATSTMTNAEGNYFVPFLPVGVDRVSFLKAGFKEQVHQDITLVMNQKFRLDVVLQVGQSTQIVTVTGSATQLNR